jgi:phospholipid transport system transporter-binding protein
MRREGDRLILEGEVTLGLAAAALAESLPLMAEGVSVVDFAGVTTTDSAAIALAVEWSRLATAGGRSLKFANMPESMRNMAKLYAVTELLP